MTVPKLGPSEMEQELKRLKDSIDLSCVEDVEFLRHYVELLDASYMQQAVALQMAKTENREIWESNERITRELQEEIARLKAELREVKPVRKTSAD